MALFLAKFSLTAESWAKLIAQPEDRRKALEPALTAVGGKLQGFWYAFGEADGYVLVEAADETTVAAALVKVAASGAFTQVATTRLLTVEEMLQALARAGDMPFRAPGGAST